MESIKHDIKYKGLKMLFKLTDFTGKTLRKQLRLKCIPSKI